MEEPERHERVTIIADLFTRLGRRPDGKIVDGLVRGTAAVPRAWLREAIKHVSGTWTHSMRNPTSADLYQAATCCAGFEARYSAWGGYTDPAPELVKWWPQHPQRVPRALAQEFALPPPDGLAALIVPTDRRQALPETTQPLELAASGGER